MTDRWNAFAEREPYFAVLTQPRFLRGRLDDASRAEFFKSGEQYVSDLIVTLSRIAPRFVPRTVLEYGCGAGRLLIPLARAYESVTGVDRAPAMLHHARTNLEAANTPAVELLESAGMGVTMMRGRDVHAVEKDARERPAEHLDPAEARGPHGLAMKSALQREKATPLRRAVLRGELHGQLDGDLH